MRFVLKELLDQGQIRRPSPNEIDTCHKISLTSEDDWDLISYQGFVSSMQHDTHDLITTTLFNPISSDLTSEHLSPMMSTTPILLNINDQYISISAINFKRKNALLAEELSNKWNI